MLRDFQVDLKARIYEAWSRGAKDVLTVLATGGGKTVLFCNLIAELDRPTCVIAHRQELVAQAALQLNREQVAHGIIAPTAIQKQIIALEQETHGRSFYSPRAHVRVAGVDTLIRHDTNDPWPRRVEIVVQDEAHHRLVENKWGRAQLAFENARALGFTAHAIRADGKGLGKPPAGSGLVDELIVGPSARELIDRGFLVDYRLITPPTDVHIGEEKIGASGEFKMAEVRAAVHASPTIVGDVVKHYLRFAAGKLGITFAVDIEAATEIAAKYNAEGIPAEIITALTPLAVRGQLMRNFRARKLLQLVSVDVLGEGVDVPAVEVVSMARPTASFQLYSQQFGRALRLMLTDAQNATWNERTDAQRVAEIAASAKPKAIIIDHVENYDRHGLPDVPREYTLANVTKRKRKSDQIPLRYCLNEECFCPYPAYLSACPNCGTPRPAAQRRGTAEQVDGDLIELDPVILHQLRQEQAKVDGPVKLPQDISPTVAGAITKRHRERQEAQRELRDTMGLWAGWQKTLGRDEREAQRLFFYRFGRDCLTAQTLGAMEAGELRERIADELARNNIVEHKI